MTADPLIELFAESLAGKTDGEIELIAHGSPAVHFACYCRIRDKNNAEIGLR
jgi:hypothetical protein